MPPQRLDPFIPILDFVRLGIVSSHVLQRESDINHRHLVLARVTSRIGEQRSENGESVRVKIMRHQYLFQVRTRAESVQ